VECYSTSGDKDYVLRVLVSDVEHYEKLLKRTLAHLPNVVSINSTFALKQVKYTTQLPL
jgi:Lrp/AsnC family transcriptional regulator